MTFYEYDLYGNLLSVALPDGRTIEYDVDGAGRRVGRRVLDAQGTEIEYRGWIYRDLLRPIAEVDAAGNVVARYVYDDGAGARQNGVGQLSTRIGANQDVSLPFVGSNVPELIEEFDGSGTALRILRLSTNQVGSVQLVTDTATGEVVQRIQHDAFGRTLLDTSPGLQPFGFAGGLVDPDTALVRFGARDYAPEVGRWTARDAVRERGGSNPYLYVDSDPVNGKDPTGFENPLKDIINLIKEILGLSNRVSCAEAEQELAKAKKKCQEQQSACWGPDSNMSDCAQSCEDTGFNPTSPSDDWFQCYKASPEWRQYGEACSPSWYDFL